MECRWEYKPQPDPKDVEHLCKEINVSPIVASLLVQRGIYTFEEAKQYFRPSHEHLHDPFLMKDMHKAVERINKAFENGEHILVYGDYDVDGTTSVALVYLFLKKHHTHVHYYLPDRYSEGYGISYKGIDCAAEWGCTLIIALDCGIKSSDKISYAKSKNIDFIVCDHHLPGADIPDACAVLDPKQPDCSYPYKELCGCGIGFKLLQALSLKNHYPLDDLFSYLDLVAIATCADIVPLTGENRTLVALGMKQINEHLRPGIKALLEVGGLKKIKDVSDIVFIIGPRINAAGRMNHANIALQLLLADTDNKASETVKLVDKNNSDRKATDSSITLEALEMIEANPEYRNAKATVLYNERWHKGVIGIVASRCIEKYHRPTIIFTKSGEYAAGSARSVPGFDIHAAIEQCSEHVVQFGGHMYAAGITLLPEKINDFREKFIQVVEASIEEHMLVPTIHVDSIISLQSITPKLYNILSQMAPFGPKNMQPVFVAENVYDDGRAKVLKQHHLKLFLTQASNIPPVEAIAFNMAQHYYRIAKREKFNVCFSIEENDYNGKKNIQLFVRDIKFTSPQ
ncbi:MAG: single-stranded-DNA-specific exonuclease RecJ [Cytophagaceae bacterium]|nr:single-stranded-DNA-specific exonuclease RecJ [Cytophagaceae bacterium]MDW8457165.1 single-stranded-DNA-specific exonuclease RecJ [Cytophagaceae bacterium]